MSVLIGRIGGKTNARISASVSEGQFWYLVFASALTRARRRFTVSGVLPPELRHQFLFRIQRGAEVARQVAPEPGGVATPVVVTPISVSTEPDAVASGSTEAA